MNIFDVKLGAEATLSGNNNDNMYSKYFNFKDALISTDLFTDAIFRENISNSVNGGTIHNPSVEDILDDGNSSDIMISPLMSIENNRFVRNLRISFSMDEDKSQVKLNYSLILSDLISRKSEITYNAPTISANLYDTPSDVISSSIKVHRFLQYSTTSDYIFIVSFATVINGIRSIVMLYVVFTNETHLYTLINHTYPLSLTSSPVPLKYLNIYDYWIVNNSTTLTIYIVPKCNFGYEFNSYYKITQLIGNKDTGQFWMAPEYTSLSLYGTYNLDQLNNISIHSKFHDGHNLYVMDGNNYDYTFFDSSIGGISDTKEATQTSALPTTVYVVASASINSYTDRQIYLMKLQLSVNSISIIDCIQINSINPGMVDNLGYTMGISLVGNAPSIFTCNGVDIVQFQLYKNTTYTSNVIYDELVRPGGKLSLTPVQCNNTFRYQMFGAVFEPHYDANFKNNTKWVSVDGVYYIKLIMKNVNSISSPHLYLYNLDNNELLLEVIPNPTYVITANNLPSYNSIYKVITSDLIFHYFVRMNGINFDPSTDSSRNFNHFFKSINYPSSNYYCVKNKNASYTSETSLTNDYIMTLNTHGIFTYSQQYIKFIPSETGNQSLYYNTTGTNYTKIIKHESLAECETTIYFNSIMNLKQITQYKLDEVTSGQFNTLSYGTLTTEALNNYNAEIIVRGDFTLICELNKIHVYYWSSTTLKHLYTIITKMSNPSKQIKLTESKATIQGFTQNIYSIGTGDKSYISTNKNIKTIYTKDGITHISETPLSLTNNTYNSVDADVVHYASVTIEGKTVVFFGSKHDSI